MVLYHLQLHINTLEHLIYVNCIFVFSVAETCWEEPSEGFVSLLDQQLEELVNIFAMTFASTLLFTSNHCYSLSIEEGN